MKISLKTFKFEVFRMFSRRVNFVFATISHPELSKEISSARKLANDIAKENSGCEKSSKTKCVRFEKIRNVSNVHFFNEVFSLGQISQIF